MTPLRDTIRCESHRDIRTRPSHVAEMANVTGMIAAGAVIMAEHDCRGYQHAGQYQADQHNFPFSVGTAQHRELSKV